MEEERWKKRKGTTMGGSQAGVLEGWRLLNQQKPLGGWFSDASSTSATESFPSYLSLLPAHPPLTVIPLSFSLSLALSPSVLLFASPVLFRLSLVLRSRAPPSLHFAVCSDWRLRQR